MLLAERLAESVSRKDRRSTPAVPSVAHEEAAAGRSKLSAAKSCACVWRAVCTSGLPLRARPPAAGWPDTVPQVVCEGGEGRAH